MSKEREIADNLRLLIGAVEFDTMLCKVVSIDNDVTCTVKSVKSDVDYKNIKLNANINEDKGIYVFPEEKSYVLVTLIDKVNGFISMYSEIKKIKLKVNDIIEINDGTNDGLVQIKELTEKLNDLVKTFNEHTHSVSTEGNALKQTGTAAPTSNQADDFSKSDYENDKIKH